MVLQKEKFVLFKAMSILTPVNKIFSANKYENANYFHIY